MNTINTIDICSIPKMIDISCVKADITIAELASMVELAKKYGFICCFAMPCYTEWLIDKLAGCPEIMVGGAVGFPSGADLAETKAHTAKTLAGMGCSEIDMVINYSALRSRDYGLVLDDIKGVRESVGGIPLKVILEVAYLTDDDIRHGCELAVRAGADYIKTGTGWAQKPTTIRHVKLIKSIVGDSAKIKAAGGIKTLAAIIEMAEEGCARFGVGVASAQSIMDEAAGTRNRAAS